MMLSPVCAGVVEAGTRFYLVRRFAPSPLTPPDLVTQETLGLINSDGKLAADTEMRSE